MPAFNISNQVNLFVLILLIVSQKEKKIIPPRLGFQGFIFVKSPDMVKGTKTFHPLRYACFLDAVYVSAPSLCYRYARNLYSNILFTYNANSTPHFTERLSGFHGSL